jgi:RNA polymerase sigma factor (sigma-70 family)
VSTSAEFNDKNQELFRQRFAVVSEIETLEKELLLLDAKKVRSKTGDVKDGADGEVEKPVKKKKSKRTRLEIEHDLRVAKRLLDTITTAIIDTNYGLVLNYVRKFTSTTNREDSRDFEGAAVLGLMKAISSYDPDKGSKFSTWAYKPIQRECLKAVRDADFKQLNPGDFEKRPDILRAVKELQAGRDDFRPAFEDIAEKAGATVDTVKRVINAPRLESLAKPMNEDGKTYLGDMIPDVDPSVEDTVIATQELNDLERFGLNTLDERELFVVSRRFGLDAEPPQRLSAIGNILGLSREAVRQVESKALSKLNHPTVRRKLLRHGRS